jgi:DNA topoisomerase-2
MDVTKYKKHDLREHIYELPGMYIGSIDATPIETYVFDDATSRMTKKLVNYVPGLLKIYDEILTNAQDSAMRLKTAGPDGTLAAYPVKNIKIQVNKETGVIDVFNDGMGIPVKIAPEHGIYVPELVFGNLLTSANYGKDEERLVGGTHGIGAKATSIYSKRFEVDVVDNVALKRYTQVFHDNMKIPDKPSITKCTKNPYVHITFLPDYARFGLEGITDDMFALFRKRAMDACATTDPTVSVYFNGEKLAFKSFEGYADLYLGSKADHPRVHEAVGDRWEVVATYSDSACFEHVSFVNGITTLRGGKHVDYITNQITKKLAEIVTAKKKKEVKPQHLRDNLMVFIKCLIRDPTFDSQTKETLTSPVSKFGSKCELSDKFFDKLFKTGICEKAVSLTEFHETKQATKTDGKKTNRVLVPKLDDAQWAGTKNSKETTLILTEGDSARSLAISGLSVIGREKFGVFPLKGKILNVLDHTVAKISANAEITALKKILGLENGKTYDDLSALRYGQIMIMCDADHDGSHIKGLLFNFFQALWPSLVRKEGFLVSMQTPIMKVTKTGKAAKTAKTANAEYFYNLNDFEAWLALRGGDMTGLKAVYLKGLGSSTENDAKHYFTEMKKVTYTYTDAASDNALDLAFNKKRADNRKEWLMTYDRTKILDHTAEKVPYEEFIHKDLIHFSNRDIERSIGHLGDGLKESQRKILYACFKRRLFTNEIKVAQLGGYVSETAAYHHGEASLFGAIVGMAQNFVGANNIPLLVPEGQFGTRLSGGNDAASPRYIFTRLSELARLLFREEDIPVLRTQEDDGSPIEPEYYVPVIPLALVNGMAGIGTGFSTNIPCHNPSDIIDICMTLSAAASEHADDLPGAYAAVRRTPIKDIRPWYLGFKGSITKAAAKSFQSRGVYEFVDDQTLMVSELPVGMWTDNFKEDLVEKLTKGSTILKDFENHSTTKNVRFKLILYPGAREKLEKGKKVDSEFGLATTKGLSLSNMHLFPADKAPIRKFNTTQELIMDWTCLRLRTYRDRKEHQLQKLEHDHAVLSAKVRFIRAIIEGEFVIMNRDEADVHADLATAGYPTFDTTPEHGAYNYLTNLPIKQLTKERKIALETDAAKIAARIEDLKGTPITTLWTQELEALRVAWDAYRDETIAEIDADSNASIKRGTGTGIRKRATTATKKK